MSSLPTVPAKYTAREIDVIAKIRAKKWPCHWHACPRGCGGICKKSAVACRECWQKERNEQKAIAKRERNARYAQGESYQRKKSACVDCQEPCSKRSKRCMRCAALNRPAPPPKPPVVKVVRVVVPAPPKPPKACPDCGQSISHQSIRCRECARIALANKRLEDRREEGLRKQNYTGVPGSHHQEISAKRDTRGLSPEQVQMVHLALNKAETYTRWTDVGASLGMDRRETHRNVGYICRLWHRTPGTIRDEAHLRGFSVVPVRVTAKDIELTEAEVHA